MRQKREFSPLALLLVAAQGDEAFVVRCACQMRQHGFAVVLLGLYEGPVVGEHGVWLSERLFSDWSNLEDWTNLGK